MAQNNDNDKIGYRKPPKNTRFKLGQSGNPNGRPRKNPQNIINLIAEEFEEKIKISQNGKEMSVTKLRAAVKRLINGAINGNQKDMAAMLRLFPLVEKYYAEKAPSETMPIINFIDDIVCESKVLKWIAENKDTDLSKIKKALE